MLQDRHSIGIFDSGIGGLTVMKQIVRHLPNEDIIYFGDTARLPYGGKSSDTILRYSIENTIFLMEKNIKLLVIACNTASAVAVEKLRKIFNIPVIGVINPGISKAISTTKNGRIGILGTRSTINSSAYARGISEQLPSSTVFSIACPLFVHLVEELLINHSATKLIIKEYLAPLKEKDIDTLVLGCTHYPLLKEMIQEELGEHVQLIDSAVTCAESVKQVLHNQQLTSTKSSPGTHHYFVSDDPEKFRLLGKEFLGLPIDHVTLISSNLS